MPGYDYILVESFRTFDTAGRHGDIHIRPLSGQGEYRPDMFVECSKSLSYDYPVGTKFRINAKISRREGGTPFVYCYFNWDYEVIETTSEKK